MTASQRVVIVDCGSQFTQLIARRLREQQVYCEVVPPWVTTEEISAAPPAALILSGGPASVHEADAPRVNPEILDLDVPVLGICYGMYLLAEHLGGLVEAADESEYGRAEFAVCETDEALFEGVAEKSTVWMSHGDRVTRLPAELEAIGTSDNCPFAAVRHRSRPLYGLQFHPEVVHTEAGAQILQNFLGIAGVKGDWTMGQFLESQLVALRAEIGSGQVICGVSGGVDSTVVAQLLKRAIGDQLHCIFVDNGLLRQNEAAEVERIFDDLGIPLRTIDASEMFLERLDGIDDPEQKRVIIGHAFIEVFE